MSLLADPPEVLARFDAVCHILAAHRRGLTLEQLRDAHALARELEADDSDRNRVEDLTARLGIDVEDLVDDREG